MIQRLSHPIIADGPNWPGAPGVSIRPRDRMSAGDVADTHVVEIYTHYGTHCDVPSHFIPGGRSLSDLDVMDFVFDSPLLIDLDLGDGELVEPTHLQAHVEQIRGCDLLLIRSRFEQHRADKGRYEHSGPGFSAAGAAYLREAAPALRGLAVDWLSLCALDHVDEGADAHRILLADRDGAHVLIFEDVSLSGLTGSPERVFAFPLFIAGLDGSPCTIVAEVDNK